MKAFLNMAFKLSIRFNVQIKVYFTVLSLRDSEKCGWMDGWING